MQLKRERGVPHGEHNPAGKFTLDWENARVFLEISRHKSFRAAASALHQSVNALRRRLDQFERQLGMTLFTRHVDGVRLTEEGERIAAVAQRMETDSFDLMRAKERPESPMAGEVRVAITEGLGGLWLAPRLFNFQQANRDIRIDLRCQMETADVLRLEADIAVQLVRPSQNDVRVVKLGRLHTMPFAAKTYIETHGMPKSVADVPNHSLVVQVAPQVTDPDPYIHGRLGGGQPLRISMQTNLGSAHLFAVLGGWGLGMLPTYIASFAPSLVPIDIDFRSQHDIWLVYHPDSARIPRVRRMIDAIAEAFSPQRFPCFADEFIHPTRLPRIADDVTRYVLSAFPPGAPRT